MTDQLLCSIRMLRRRW